jgi:hypothetical protein
MTRLQLPTRGCRHPSGLAAPRGDIYRALRAASLQVLEHGLRGQGDLAGDAAAAIRRQGLWPGPERHDEWTEMRRYIGLDVLARARMTVIRTEQATEELPLSAINA